MAELWDRVTKKLEPYKFVPVKDALAKVLALDIGFNRFPGAQVTSLDCQGLCEKLMRTSYYVCEKTDGERYLLVLLPNKRLGGSVLVSRRNEMRVVPNLEMPTEVRTREGGATPFRVHELTVLDGELVEPKDHQGPVACCLIRCCCCCVCVAAPHTAKWHVLIDWRGQPAGPHPRG